jgi:flavin-dependent dehydrogenase
MNRKHAVVIGAGIGGLVAARVLSELFDQVTVIEMDPELASNRVRKGAPQALHPHNLLCRGKNVVCELFPGLDQDLEKGGAPLADIPKHMKRLGGYGAWEPQHASGIQIRLVSRPFLESHIVERVKKLGNVRWILSAAVSELIYDAKDCMVTGVRYKKIGQHSSGETELFADLVVDASGRKSGLKGWLTKMGIEPPGETCVESAEWYATQHYRLRDESRSWKVMYIPKTSPVRPRARGAYMGEIEKGFHIVAVVGASPEKPPKNEAEFLAFVKTVESGETIVDELRSAEAHGKMEYFSNFDNVCLRIDLAKTWPKRLTVLGDALARFNPVFGQGMSTAVEGAHILGEALKQEIERQRNGATESAWEDKFHRELLWFLETPWAFSTMQSLSQSPIGKDAITLENAFRLRSRSPWQRLKWLTCNFSIIYIYRAMFNDTNLHTKFIRTQHLLQPFAMLYRPENILRAIAILILLKLKLKRPFSQTRHPDQPGEAKQAA